MRRLILGTAGHIDHGKTSLVRALTGVDTDRLPEEKRRGITIDLGFALMTTDDLEIGIVDVPGHEALVRNMLAGATGIDLVLLVIAADEGVMPQTREHLAIMELLEVGAAVVALTKADLVDTEWLDLVTNDVWDVLSDTRFRGAPVIPVSSTTRSGIDELRNAIASTGAGVAVRSEHDLFRMPVDRAFTVHGTGTVVTGTVWSGEVRRDANLVVMPGDCTARARGLQVHAVVRDSAVAGERVALALAADRSDIRRGDVLVADAAWTPSMLFTAHVRILDDVDRPLRHRQRVRFHLGTAEILARVAVLEGDVVEPGASAWIQLRLEEPCVARAGDHFVIRSYSPVHTIGGGVIAEPLASKRKRIDEVLASRLHVLAGVGGAGSAAQSGGADEALATLLSMAGRDGVSVAALPLLLPFDAESVTASVDLAAKRGTAVLVADRVFDRNFADRAMTAVTDAVVAFHKRNPLAAGLPRQELRAVAEEVGTVQTEWAIQALVRDGQMHFDDGFLAVTGFSRTTDPAQTAAGDAVLAVLTRAGIEAPAISELPADLKDRPDILTILRYLETQGRVVALTRDRFAEAGAIRALAERLSTSFESRQQVTTSDLKDEIGVTRKYLIPILEFFDREGICRRTGDDRIWIGVTATTSGTSAVTPGVGT